MSKKNKKKQNTDKKQDLVVTERKTTVEIPPKKGCTIPLISGCLVPIIFSALVVLSVRECKRSGVRLEQENFKLQQMKDGTFVDTDSVKRFDTIKTTYLPKIQEFQKTK